MSITIGDALLKQCLFKTHLSTVAEDNPELIVDASLLEPNDEQNILYQAAKMEKSA